MKKTIQILLTLATFGASALIAQAQPAPKILVVDMAKLYDGHYKTEEQKARLRDDEKKASDEIQRLNKEGNDLVEKYKELVDQSKNPAATSEAKAKAQSDAQKMLDDIHQKQGEVQSFQNNARSSLQDRIQKFRSMMIEEISKVAVQIAKDRGATLLIDKSGPSLIGVSNILYSDPAYDITDAVSAEINKNRPATAPAASPAPAASDSPKITVPGVAPKTN